METSRTIRIPERLRVLVTLSQLLEHLETAQAVGVDQYRSVVQHLVEELGRLDADETLDLLLGSFPATAELYENQHYHQAGLCRSPLELSLNSEVQARVALERAAAAPAAS